eukprot:TRINITY_DN70435_c0_g1_i1.p1 TRINITY_DN70435_c0_g1~~TRINITY_DN70435_c0_g1_i1.p1  ORF type:complete len:675 (-),score=133.93 TRINITY_DN70435_c0_g1_i1:277-2301(-)
MAAVALNPEGEPCDHIDELCPSVEHWWMHRVIAFSVLDCLPLEEQLRAVFFLSAFFRSQIQVGEANSSGWCWLFHNLCAHRNLWAPPAVEQQALLAGDRGSWRALFHDLWPLRHRFVKEAAEGNATVEAERATFRLASYCRFRAALEPGKGATFATARANGPSVALPLHQRVALLRQAQPALSKKEAVQQVTASYRKEQERQQQHHAQPSDGEEEPGTSAFTASVLSVQAGVGGSVLTVSPGCGLRSFGFGHVFDGNAGQAEVYESCGLRLVTDLVNGVNGALILYGQTGSGKTYTMFGPADGGDAEKGIAQRIADVILEAGDVRRKKGFTVNLSLTYAEIFGNEVHDLLGDVRQDCPTVTQHLLSGGLEIGIKDRDELLAALAHGASRKRCAKTAMNEQSTRAHTILVFRLQQQRPGVTVGEPPVTSLLFLADLGGSERVTKSHANEDAKSAGTAPWSEYYHSRRRLTETNHINQGLLSLKRCIRALDERQRRGEDGRKLPIPFRDSRLTSILEPALGGLARTAVIVCCSPESQHAEETVQTLRFGEQCSQIEHVDKAKADPSSAIAKALRQIDDEVAEVEHLIREKERWEWQENLRVDVVDANDMATGRVNPTEEMELGGFGAVEFLPVDSSVTDQREVEHKVWGQKLVGAEVERELLEVLLERRRRLLGES